MRWTARGLAALMIAAMLSGVLALGALSETADDEWVGTLLVARDELDKGLAEIDQELAAIPARIASDDWRVFPTESGQVVEVDLRVLEDYVPVAQLIAGHPDIKPVLLDALKQADPNAWAAVSATEYLGGIENLPPADVMALVRTFYTQSLDDKRDAYAARQAKLTAEHADLKALRDDIQRQLDAIAAAAGASPSPEASLEPSPEPSPVPERSAEPTPLPSAELTPEPSPEPSAAASPCPEGDMWCQDDDPRPSPQPSAISSSTPSPEPADPTPGIEADGVQYDALEGLVTCAEGDPVCSTVETLMSCWGNDLGCYAPVIQPDPVTELWSTGIFDGDFEGWGVTAQLEQDGSAITGTIVDKKGPLEIVAEEVRRNRVEGHYFGDVFWQVGRDDGSMGPSGAPFDGCSEPRDGTTQWGELTIEVERYGGDLDPQVHLTVGARPCDQAWREANPAYDNANQWLVDGARTPPTGFDWATSPLDAEHAWTGDWHIDLGSMRIDQQDDHLTGVILSPGGQATFQADPMDAAMAGDLYDPAVTMVGSWQGDAFGAWLAGFGSVSADWQCAVAREGSDQWGDILLRIGGHDGDAPDRVDAAWRPCDQAWRESIGYDDDYDWWYDGEDTFTGWRLRPAAEDG